MSVSSAPRSGFGVLRLALPLAGVAIEFFWLFPWVLLLTGAFYGASPPALLPPVPAFLLLALGFIAVRGILAQPWPLVQARIAVVASGIVAGLAAVKFTYYPGYGALDPRWVLLLLRSSHDALPTVLPEVMAALTATLLWWRGVVLGERDLTHFEIDRAFRRGAGWTIVFLIFFVLYGGSRGFAATQSAPAYLLAFFSLSLLMLAVTRLLALWQESQADEAQALSTNRHWLLLLVAVVGLILSGAVVISGLLNVQFRPLVLHWLKPLEPVVEAIFLVLFAAALVIAKGIIFVLSHLPWRAVRIEPPEALQQPFSALLRDLPPRVVSSARWGMVLLVIAVLILVVAIAVVRARRKAKKGDEDERESVWDPQSLLAGMGNAWHSLWARRRTASGDTDSPETSSIRTVYRELLRAGTALGITRRAYETPFEYEPRLTTGLPEGAHEIAALTQAYVRVRYSPHVPTEGEVAAAKTAMNRIREVAAEPQDRS